jgi:hypothetical protein
MSHIYKCFLVLDKNYKNNGIKLKKGVNECVKYDLNHLSSFFDINHLFYCKGNKLAICEINYKERSQKPNVDRLTVKKIYELHNLPYWGSKKFIKDVIYAGYNTGDRLQYVNKKYIDQELCDLAIERFCSLKYIPVCFRTPELCYDAMYDGDDLEFVPEELKTPELCMRAIKKGGSIKFVPKELQTAELLEQAENEGYGPRYPIGTPLINTQWKKDDVENKESPDNPPIIVYARPINFILISDNPFTYRFCC